MKILICFEHGVVIIAVAGNVLRFQPPLVITYEQLDKALDVIEEALQALQDGWIYKEQEKTLSECLSCSFSILP